MISSVTEERIKKDLKHTEKLGREIKEFTGCYSFTHLHNFKSSSDNKIINIFKNVKLCRQLTHELKKML